MLIRCCTSLSFHVRIYEIKYIMGGGLIDPAFQNASFLRCSRYDNR